MENKYEFVQDLKNFGFGERGGGSDNNMVDVVHKIVPYRVLGKIPLV